MKDIINIGTVNYQPVWGNVEENRKRMLEYMEDAYDEGIDLLVFPETALSGYDNEPDVPRSEKMQTKVAETIPGESTDIFAEAAKKYNMYVVFGMAEKDAETGIVYNSAVVVGPQGLVTSYRKIHLALDEMMWADKGDKPCVFDTPWGPVGLAICYDSYSYHELIRYSRAKGARIYINCTACGYNPAVYDRKAAEQSRKFFKMTLEYACRTNTMYVVSSNLVGIDKDTDFYGCSSIIGPDSEPGSIKYCAGAEFTDNVKGHTPGLLSAVVDLRLTEREKSKKMYHTNPKTGAPDWRPEVYQKMYEDLLVSQVVEPVEAVDILNIAVVNFQPAWGDKRKNLEKMCAYIDVAAKKGVQLLVFPETALSGYDDEKDKERKDKMQSTLAETIPGPSSVCISEYAQKYGMYIIFGMPQKDDTEESIVYNSAAICMPNGTITSYQKIHLAGEEPNWASCGKKPCIIDTPWGPVGVAICYDVYSFPELIRYARAKGARLFINCTACAEIFNPEVAQNELETVALQNDIYIASANLCGWDSYNHFYGNSSIIGPAARYRSLVYYAGYPFTSEEGHNPELIQTTLDLSLVGKAMDNKIFGINKKTGTPDLRPDIYLKLVSDIVKDEKWKNECIG